jgi:hypothetical protein
VYEVSETTAIDAQVAQIHHMMETLLTPPALPEVVAKPVQVITDSTEVTCVYRGGAHLFEDCSANPVSVKYVSNFSKITTHLVTLITLVGRAIKIFHGQMLKINKSHKLHNLAMLLRTIANWRQFQGTLFKTQRILPMIQRQRS